MSAFEAARACLHILTEAAKAEAMHEPPNGGMEAMRHILDAVGDANLTRGFETAAENGGRHWLKFAADCTLATGRPDLMWRAGIPAPDAPSDDAARAFSGPH